MCRRRRAQLILKDNRNATFKLDAQEELTEKTQRNTTTITHPKKCSPIISDNELKCVCLNARSIVNNKSELDIMVTDSDPHVIGITESWANKDIVDAELALPGYVMFRKDRRERRGGRVITYIKESIQAYEITLKSEADCEEAIWCNIVTRNSILTIGVVYRSPNIGQEEGVKLQKAVREVNKGECVIMGDFNHGHIQWESLESTGGDDHEFLLLHRIVSLLNMFWNQPEVGMC